MVPVCRRPFSFFLPLLLRILPSYSTLHIATCWNFQWNASLDRNTGKASSYEQSSTKLPTQQQRQQSSTSCGSTTRVTKVIESCFQSYPLWLCSKSVTFGLLRANSIRSSLVNDTVTIQDSVFHQNLLIFGKPRRIQPVRLKSTMVGSRNLSRLCNLTDKQKIVEVTFEFPIKGGLLTYCPTTLNDDDQERGSIRLSCFFPQTPKKQNEDSSAEAITIPFSIESKIVNFLPRIGGPPPVPRIRQIVYLNTQRLVHAYVMRQFHHHCYKNLTLS
jgi:hypothetical protein